MFITFNGEVILESILASIIKLDANLDILGKINETLYDLGIRLVEAEDKGKKTQLRAEKFEKIDENLMDIISSKHDLFKSSYMSIDRMDEILDLLDLDQSSYKNIRRYILKLKREIEAYDPELIKMDIFDAYEIAIKLASFSFIEKWLRETDTILTVDYPILGVPSLGINNKFDAEKYDISVSILKDLELEIKGDVLSKCDVLSALFLSQIPSEIGASLSGKVKSWSIGSFDNYGEVISYIVDMDTYHASEYLIETNIDDMSSERYEIIEYKLFKAGALDVYKTNIIMKKGRPAVKLSVLSPESCINNISDILFLDSSTLGFRMHKVDKIMMKRKHYRVKTSYGTINVKAAISGEKIVKYKAEFDDIKDIAINSRAHINDIYDEVDLKFKKIIKKFNS